MGDGEVGCSHGVGAGGQVGLDVINLRAQEPPKHQQRDDHAPQKYHAALERTSATKAPAVWH